MPNRPCADPAANAESECNPIGRTGQGGGQPALCGVAVLHLPAMAKHAAVDACSLPRLRQIEVLHVGSAREQLPAPVRLPPGLPWQDGKNAA